MSSLDEAYDRLAAFAPEYGGGLSDHAPMVVEVLDRVGRTDRLGPWLDGYVSHLDPGPAPGRVLTTDEQQERLGIESAFAAWVATFDAALTESDTADVLRWWLPTLVPGLLAAAAHGALRVAHAARAMLAAPSPPRRHELARALAYWASTWEPAPAWPPLTGTQPLTRVLDGIPVLPAEQRKAFFITDRARRAGSLDGFAEWIDMVAPPADPRSAVIDVAVHTAAAAERHATSSAIAYVHCVTGPLAVADLCELVGVRQGQVVEDALRATVAVVAAVDAGFRTVAPPPEPARRNASETGQAIASRSLGESLELAIESGEEHAIKYADACVRLAGRRPDATDAVAASAAAIVDALV